MRFDWAEAPGRRWEVGVATEDMTVQQSHSTMKLASLWYDNHSAAENVRLKFIKLLELCK